MANKKGIADRVRELITQIITEIGFRIWDVEYVKEGTEWYLRITIDSDEGIKIEDCERVYNAVDPIIEASDPIEGAYRLEVSSPGIERELRLAEHFKASIGMNINVKLYTARDGVKAMTGKLTDYSGENGTEDIIDIIEIDGEIKIKRTEAAMVKIVYNYEEEESKK